MLWYCTTDRLSAPIVYKHHKSWNQNFLCFTNTVYSVYTLSLQTIGSFLLYSIIINAIALLVFYNTCLTMVVSSNICQIQQGGEFQGWGHMFLIMVKGGIPGHGFSKQGWGGGHELFSWYKSHHCQHHVIITVWEAAIWYVLSLWWLTDNFTLVHYV